jgi:predicted SprT family Zn-dependent metalloprotease
MIDKKEFQAYYDMAMTNTWRVDGKDYNLDLLGWEWGYGRTRKIIGRCRVRKKAKSREIISKRIEISTPYLNVPGQNMAEMKDTVLHEIAHAIDVERRGTSDHSATWKHIARAVGADPTRTSDIVKSVPGRYKLTCPDPDCDLEVYMYRKPKVRKSCNRHGNTFDPTYEMEVHDTHTGERVHVEPRRRHTSLEDLIGF